jgi:hypothetical protein
VLVDASNIPQSRAAQKREDQKHLQQKYEDDCVDLKSRKIDDENTLRKQSIWAKLHAAANLLREQGQLDDFEKTLNLLDRMKPTIPDSEYTSQVRAVFKVMRNSQRDRADVEVIIVNDWDHENRLQIIEVWDPKDSDEE